MVEAICRKCGSPNIPPSRLRRRDHICSPCKHAPRTAMRAHLRMLRQSAAVPSRICVDCLSQETEDNRFHNKTLLCRQCYNARAAVRRARGPGPTREQYRLLQERKRANPDWRVKDLARRALQRAVAKGMIVRKPCMFCGGQNSDGHHEDYMRPLDVYWLCREHHAKLHSGDLCLLPRLNQECSL